MHASRSGTRLGVPRWPFAAVDACQSVFVFTAAKGEPIHVHHEKARLTGLLHEDFALTIEDVEQDGDPRGALRVRVDDLERLACEAAEQKNDALCEAVLAFVRDNPGCTQREIRTGVTGQGNRITAATDRLARTGAIKNLGTGQRQAWHACGPGGVV